MSICYDSIPDKNTLFLESIHLKTLLFGFEFCFIVIFSQFKITNNYIT